MTDLCIMLFSNPALHVLNPIHDSGVSGESQAQGLVP